MLARRAPTRPNGPRRPTSLAPGGTSPPRLRRAWRRQHHPRGAFGVRADDWLPEPVRDARTIVVLIIDGLGWDAITDRAGQLPELARLTGGPVTTVVPSTTASALTSITTGLPPSQHGVIGFRVLSDHTVLNVLSWQTTPSVEPPNRSTCNATRRSSAGPSRWSPRPSSKAPASPKRICAAGRFLGWRAVSGSSNGSASSPRPTNHSCTRTTTASTRSATAHGLHDGFYDAELRAVDRLVGDLRDVLAPDATLLVSADHGQVHVGPERWLSLGPLDAGSTERGSGDGRFRYLHARRGDAAPLLEQARDRFAEQAWVLSREQLLDEAWLGPAPSPPARRRIGDVILAAGAPVAFIDPALPREARLVSAHGSLTPAEMYVPLVAGRGRA